MSKALIAIIVIIVIVLLGWWFFASQSQPATPQTPTTQNSTANQPVTSADTTVVSTHTAADVSNPVDSSNTSINQDLNNVDTQITDLSTDSANVNQSINQ